MIKCKLLTSEPLIRVHEPGANPLPFVSLGATATCHSGYRGRILRDLGP